MELLCDGDVVSQTAMAVQRQVVAVQGDLRRNEFPCVVGEVRVDDGLVLLGEPESVRVVDDDCVGLFLYGGHNQVHTEADSGNHLMNFSGEMVRCRIDDKSIRTEVVVEFWSEEFVESIGKFLNEHSVPY